MITGECLKIINEHTQPINCINPFSIDSFISCSADQTIKLFDLNTFNCIRTFIGHEDEVWNAEKISNEKLVSCSFDKTIRIWNLNSAECLKIFKDELEVMCLKVFSKEIIISGSK